MQLSASNTTLLEPPRRNVSQPRLHYHRRDDGILPHEYSIVMVPQYSVEDVEEEEASEEATDDDDDDGYDDDDDDDEMQLAEDAGVFLIRASRPLFPVDITERDPRRHQGVVESVPPTHFVRGSCLPFEQRLLQLEQRQQNNNSPSLHRAAAVAAASSSRRRVAHGMVVVPPSSQFLAQRTQDHHHNYSNNGAAMMVLEPRPVSDDTGDEKECWTPSERSANRNLRSGEGESQETQQQSLGGSGGANTRKVTVRGMLNFIPSPIATSLLLPSQMVR